MRHHEMKESVFILRRGARNTVLELGENRPMTQIAKASPAEADVKFETSRFRRSETPGRAPAGNELQKRSGKVEP